MVEFFAILFAASLVFQFMMYLQAKREKQLNKQYELTLKIIEERNKKVNK